MTSRTSSLAVSQQCGLRSRHFARREICPARRGRLRALLAAAALLMEMRAEVAFLRKLSPEVKALRKDSKMTIDNSKPCLPTNYDWEIGVNMWVNMSAGFSEVRSPPTCLFRNRQNLNL